MRFSRAGGQTLCGFFFFGLLFFLLSGGKSFSIEKSGFVL